jgi:hypothetical protein
LPGIFLSGTTEYQKRFGKYYVTVIAKQNEKGQWIVLSCWMDPPMYGTADYEKKQQYNRYMKDYRKSSFLGRIWKDLLYAFGIK